MALRRAMSEQRNVQQQVCPMRERKSRARYSAWAPWPLPQRVKSRAISLRLQPAGRQQRLPASERPFAELTVAEKGVPEKLLRMRASCDGASLTFLSFLLTQWLRVARTQAPWVSSSWVSAALVSSVGTRLIWKGR